MTSHKIVTGASYWDERHDMIYYSTMYYMARTVGRNAQSVLDVGSNGCDYLEWFYWIPMKCSLDLHKPYRGEGVSAVKADFLDWVPDRLYDLVLCLQTLEHVPDVEAFSKKLLQCGRHLIISIPFEWPAGSPSHVHDPVTLQKLGGWMGRKANYTTTVQEPFINNGKDRRLIAYYNVEKPSHIVRRPERLARRPFKPF